MKFIISIDHEQIMRELKSSIQNEENGNFEKWDLDPHLPNKNDTENYFEAAERFLATSNWPEKTHNIIPDIQKWVDDFGQKYTLTLCKELNIDPPTHINIYLVPFGPGGSYFPKTKSIRVRIDQSTNQEWWRHVIIHEITHIINSFHNENPDHEKNEEKVNAIAMRILTRLGMTNLI
jgi:hypothetical protein